jgi:hypothetical protein
MSAIEITRRGGSTSLLAWLRGGLNGWPSRRGAGPATSQGLLAGERVDGLASAFATAAPGALDARALFARALSENSNLEQDWLWLSTIVASEGELRYCLEQALYINPHSEEARQELVRLARRHPNRAVAPRPRRHS